MNPTHIYTNLTHVYTNPTHVYTNPTHVYTRTHHPHIHARAHRTYLHSHTHIHARTHAPNTYTHATHTGFETILEMFCPNQRLRSEPTPLCFIDLVQGKQSRNTVTSHFTFP